MRRKNKRKLEEKEERRRDRKERKDPHFDISQETRNSVWGVVSFILAVLAALSFIGKAGAAGEIIDGIARSLFGWGFFIVPIAFLILGFAFMKSIHRRVYLSAVFGTLLFVLSVLAIFFIFGDHTFDVRVDHGGYLGVILGYPLERFVGFTAGLVILLALLFISMLIAFNIPIYGGLIKNGDEEEELVDKIVVKRGTEVMDADTVKQKHPESKPEPSRPARAQPMEKDFVVQSASRRGKWALPPVELLHTDSDTPSTGDINANAQIIKKTLANFGIDVEMGEVNVGPTVTRYTLRPALGVKLARITTLNSDLSLALAAHPIRIEAPIPGQSLVGIEVPNRKAAIVALRNMIDTADFKKSRYYLPLAIGRDVTGMPVLAGLERMPHLLVAGATGTGKSVTINGILLSLLYKHSPEILKLILIDPKRVELTLYDGIPHLIAPVITDTKKVIPALRWAINEMERRFDTLSRSGSRDVFSYNTKMADKGEDLMPFIVIVIDEMADLMATYGRDVEAAVVRLAQMSRAVGIHLILSTQRPSVEVITGLIKANITSRIALQVASQVDSRTILDMAGAEKLLGSGDMLYVAGDSGKPRRLQAPLVTEKEVKDVIKFIKLQAEQMEPVESPVLEVDLNAPSGGGRFGDEGDGADDELYPEAREVVIHAGKASASYLQRRLKVGYARAARLLDILEEKGVIGPGEGAKPRDVYVKPDGSTGAPEPMGISADSEEAERTEEL